MDGVISEFDPVIWPSKLFVVVGGDIDFLQSNFCKKDGTAYAMEQEDKDTSNAVTFLEVMRCDTGDFGELIWLHTIEKATLPIIAHECMHACNAILAASDVKLDSDNDETQAYTYQWVFEQTIVAFEKSKVSQS